MVTEYSCSYQSEIGFDCNLMVQHLFIYNKMQFWRLPVSLIMIVLYLAKKLVLASTRYLTHSDRCLTKSQKKGPVKLFGSKLRHFRFPTTNLHHYLTMSSRFLKYCDLHYTFYGIKILKCFAKNESLNFRAFVFYSKVLVTIVHCIIS